MLEELHNSVLLGLSAARRSSTGRWMEAQLKRRLPSLLEHLRKRWQQSQFLYDVNGVKQALRGRALLSYVPLAFTSDASSAEFLNHSNLWESREIARILGEMGFVVDVCNCLDSGFELRHKYAVLFDAGYNLERLATQLGDTCRKISYATGRHWRMNNTAEEERLRELFERRGVRLKARRTSRVSLAAERCDALFYVGNDVVCDSFSHVAAPKTAVPVSVPNSLFDDAPRDWTHARSSMLWLGSGGMVHKGLDVVLDAFADMPDMTLHIVGPFDKEQDFVESYRSELFDLANVVAHGFLDVAGDEFFAIARKCGFIVYPSCSEGTAGAVLTAMAKGLIPIVTRECGLDPRPYGYMLAGHGPQAIRDAVLDLAVRPERELEFRSAESRDFVRAHQVALEWALADVMLK